MAARQIERRNVLVVGKSGAGKSTVCNQLLNIPDAFTVKEYHDDDKADPSCCHKESKIKAEKKEYLFKVIDTIGYFDQNLSNKEILNKMKTYLQANLSEGLNLIIFVFRRGRFTKEEEEAFKILTTHFQDSIPQFSALVITNCDESDDEGRQRFVEEFKANKKSKPIAEFMKKGIYPVGFPDIQKMKPKLRDAYMEDIQTDRNVLLEVVKASSEECLRAEIFQPIFWETLQEKCTIL